MVDIESYPHLPLYPRKYLNKVKIPLVRLGNDEDAVKEFNEIYQWVLDNYYDANKFKFTPSGGIPVTNTYHFPAWNILQSPHCLELVLLIDEGQYRFIYGTQPDKREEHELTGRQGWFEFLRVCDDFNIDISEWAIPNGKEVKSTIPPPYIDLNPKFKDREIKGVYHVDMNSAYFAGICNAQKELLPVGEKIYNERKEHGRNKINKAILTRTFGFMQSQWCNMGGHSYAFAHLSKEAVVFTNAKLKELDGIIKSNGGELIAHNTDGIWFIGPKSLIDLLDSMATPVLGGFKIDHRDVTIRFKSKGAYEFIENGEYNPVVRGVNKEVLIEGGWGSIYQHVSKYYHFNPYKGLVESEDYEDA